MKNWILAAVLAVIAMMPIGYLFYSYSTSYKGGIYQSHAKIEFQQKRDMVLEPGAELHVLACEVLDGYRYYFLLEGDHQLEGHLPFATKSDAVPVVIDFLTKSNGVTIQPPSVVLRRKVDDGFWIVDLSLTLNDKRENMANLLREKHLLLLH